MKTPVLIMVSVLLWLTATVASAQQKPIPVPTPADAARLAAADCQLLPAEDQPFQTYFLTYDRSKEFYGAFNYILNTCVSHATTLYRPPVVANGWLIRVDRRRLWPQKDVFTALDAEFQKMAQIEPYFHTIGEITVKEKQTVTEKVQVEVPTGRRVQRRVPIDGRENYYRVEWVNETRTETQEKKVEKEVEVTKFGSEFSLHLLGKDANAAPVQILALATATPGFEINSNPIMRADWFIFIVSSQVQEEHGRYYAFRLLKDSEKDGKTAEQLWLESIGVDYATVQKLRSDQRIAKWRSNITGKPRAIEYFFATSARPSVGPAGVAITRDYFVGKVDAFRHAMKNLLNYDYDGAEAMGFLPNGMMIFVLFDGDGALADFAPDKLVSDRTVPSPHQTILQPPISCFRCHGTTDMWMSARNDVYALSKGKLGLNLYDDESSKEDAESTLDRLAGLYSGEMTEFLRISTNTHAKATFIVTNGMSIPEVAKKIGEIYGVYRYNAVTPQVACLELGWVVPEDQAALHLNRILPVLPQNRFGISPESVTIGTLRAWTQDNKLYVNRDDWEQEYADAMLRVQIEAVRTQASKR